MTLAQGILLLDLINRGLDAGIKVGFAYDRISKMTPDEVDAALKSERVKTKLLLEITHSI